VRGTVSVWPPLARNILSRTRARYVNYITTWIWTGTWIYWLNNTTTRNCNNWEQISTGSFLNSTAFFLLHSDSNRLTHRALMGTILTHNRNSLTSGLTVRPIVEVSHSWLPGNHVVFLESPVYPWKCFTSHCLATTACDQTRLNIDV
jgi:hypothetical protein